MLQTSSCRRCGTFSPERAAARLAEAEAAAAVPAGAAAAAAAARRPLSASAAAGCTARAATCAGTASTSAAWSRASRAPAAAASSRTSTTCRVTCTRDAAVAPPGPARTRRRPPGRAAAAPASGATWPILTRSCCHLQAAARTAALCSGRAVCSAGSSPAPDIAASRGSESAGCAGARPVARPAASVAETSPQFLPARICVQMKRWQ